MSFRRPSRREQNRPWWAGLSGWSPSFGPADQQLEAQSAGLNGLVGDQVCAAWVVRSGRSDDAWLPDFPVVLQLRTGRQLEICWFKLDEVSVSWGTIDLGARPSVAGWGHLEWRRDALPELRAILHTPITGVAVCRFLFTMSRAGNPDDIVSSVWLAAGLWIETSASGIHIYNGFDENAVSSLPPVVDDDHRLNPL